MIRKVFPYDIEIAVRADRIGFVLHTEWFRKDIKIKYISSNGESGFIFIHSDTREAVIKGLSLGINYKLILSRNDLRGIRYKPEVLDVVTKVRPYIVLIGASVGYAWDLPNLPKRSGDETFIMGYRRGKDGFDKTDALKKLIASDNRPDAIILKECAAYFPRDVQLSMNDIHNWIKTIRENDIIPILATVAPVTRECAERRGPGMIESINQFNETLRDYASDNYVKILDLNSVLEDRSHHHFLRDEYSQPDGLHLNEKAYREVLDPMITLFVQSLFEAT